ncbi:MAG TPA: GNAT family N-acetyltransferase [Caulobacteraceae bacterium]|nr:GNAT family N-acetyltransferase [Caulobacteraceae bacterium]
MDVPVLETERLRLRGHRAGDLDALTEMWAHPIVYRHITGKASDRGETWSRMLRLTGQWLVSGFGYWVVEDKATGAFVGEVGFLTGERGLDPDFADTPEAGWSLSPAMHGNGYAEEAVRAFLAWADERYPRTVCMIDPDNTASLRLAEKVSYRKYADTNFKDEPVILFERSA